MKGSEKDSMDITFLGTGGGVGLPNPFCRCERCEAVRQAGGKSLRGAPAVLINDDLLIDCGSDVFSSARQLGVRLDGLWIVVITHKHGDHLDPWFFWARRRVMDTELPPLTVYAPQNTLDSLLGFYREKKGWDQATFERETFTVCRPVRAGSFKLARQYRLSFFPASHGSMEGIEAVLVGVQDARAGYFRRLRQRAVQRGRLGVAAPTPFRRRRPGRHHWRSDGLQHRRSHERRPDGRARPAAARGGHPQAGRHRPGDAFRASVVGNARIAHRPLRAARPDRRL